MGACPFRMAAPQIDDATKAILAIPNGTGPSTDCTFHAISRIRYFGPAGLSYTLSNR